MDRERHSLERLKAVPIENIKDRLFDYKEEDKALGYKLTRSIEKFGQVQTLVVGRIEGVMYIIDGKKRLKILQELGYKNILVTDYGEIPLEHHIILCLVLNEYQYQKDYIEVSKLLQQAHKVIDSKDTHAILPYNREEIDQLITLLDFTWEGLTKKKWPDQIQLF